MTRVLMNNCRRRNHAWHFGPGAFYDLLREGKQAEMATDIANGDECIVATQDKHRRTTEFVWFKLSHEKRVVDKDGIPCRVFFGERIKSQTMPKAKAAKSSLYSAFFDARGFFKRMSIVPS
jgi:hypothetical protein